MFKTFLTLLSNTLINKNTAASAVGSGSVIVLLFTALQDRVTVIDTKVNENFRVLRGEASSIKLEVMSDVVKKHREILNQVDRVVIDIKEFREENNKRLDTLDKRVYELNQRRSK